MCGRTSVAVSGPRKQTVLSSNPAVGALDV